MIEREPVDQLIVSSYNPGSRQTPRFSSNGQEKLSMTHFRCRYVGAGATQRWLQCVAACVRLMSEYMQPVCDSLWSRTSLCFCWHVARSRGSVTAGWAVTLGMSREPTCDHRKCRWSMVNQLTTTAARHPRSPVFSRESGRKPRWKWTATRTSPETFECDFDCFWPRDSFRCNWCVRWQATITPKE